MLTIDGSPSSQPRLPGMKSYRKAAVPVTAVQQTSAFAVSVAWQEPPLRGRAGDWLLTGLGEQWPVAQDIFAVTYEHVEGDLYVMTAPVRAVQVGEPFTVHTLEGQARGDAGDYFAQGVLGEGWPIRRATFESGLYSEIRLT